MPGLIPSLRSPQPPTHGLVGSAAFCVLLAGMMAAAASVAAAEARDWSATQLAWRDDPRAAADAPSGVDVPSGKRGSRRAQRRAVTRRRQPLDNLPIAVAPADGQPLAPTNSNGFDAVDPKPRPSAAFGGPPSSSGPATPASIQADATLASPFQTAGGASSRTTHRDQPYGPHGHSRQRFDLHLPAGCNAGGMPLVVWIHGDTWRDGSKADCPITWLANEGYAVASIGYRLSDTAVFPAQLDDCRAAIVEIERNAELWGIDRRRVAVVGIGAGGHLAALVGLVQSPPADAKESDQAIPRIAAVCTVAAPTSLTTLGPVHDRAASPASRLVGGPLPEFREAAQRASPVSHISADDPPVLILHGEADTAISPNQAVAFDAALRAAGVDSTLVMFPGIGHAPPLDRGTPAGESLLIFLDRVLGPGLRPAPPPQP